MSKETEFLELFKKLEKYLRIEYNQGNYSYASFMSTIYKIKKDYKNPLIANKYNLDIIQQASQIRNIIAHNTNVIIPSDKFLGQFRDVVNKICDPLKVENIMIKISKLKKVNMNNTVGDAIELLSEYGYNTIPVIEDDVLHGIFTEKSVFDYLSMHRHTNISKNMLIKDIIEAIDLNSDPRKYFDFIARTASIEDAYEIYNHDLRNKRELLLLLVTENGRTDEAVLGIVALRDIKNALLN
jgi:CBS domain-containing protein